MTKYVVFKEIIDRVAAIIMLVALSPIMLIILLSIIIEDPETSPIFKQGRIGKDNKNFYVYKFRSMVSLTEKNGKKLSDTERMLKVGKFIRKTSLDELAQLINIIKGEMSFIGPRPLSPKYLPFYDEVEIRRHTVKPGISGWAQVNGRNKLSWEEKFALDIEYVDNISLKYDTKILFLTLIKVLRRSDVVVRGEGTEIDFHKYRMKQKSS